MSAHEYPPIRTCYCHSQISERIQTNKISTWSPGPSKSHWWIHFVKGIGWPAPKLNPRRDILHILYEYSQSKSKWFKDASFQAHLKQAVVFKHPLLNRATFIGQVLEIILQPKNWTLGGIWRTRLSAIVKKYFFLSHGWRRNNNIVWFVLFSPIAFLLAKTKVVWLCHQRVKAYSFIYIQQLLLSNNLVSGIHTVKYKNQATQNLFFFFEPSYSKLGGKKSLVCQLENKTYRNFNVT